MFRSCEKVQKKQGLAELQLFRDKADDNNIVLIFKVENMEKAKAFISAPIVDNVKEEAGVIGNVEILFLDKV